MSRAAANSCRNSHTKPVAGCLTVDVVTLGWICFPEILEKRRTAAFARLGVMDHLLKLRTGDPRLLLAFFVDEMQLLGNIARAEQQYAFARQSVASGASGLLVIALQIFRQIVMHNKTHVRFVDAHSERDRGRDHAHVVAQKCILMFCAFDIR